MSRACTRRVRFAVSPTLRTSAKQTRKAAVLQDPAARLTFRAVVDRVFLEVDACDRRTADVARLVQLVVDAVRAFVVCAALAEFEPTFEFDIDRLREPVDLLARQLGRKRVWREARVMQDLVRPCSSNPRDHALVAQERMEAHGRTRSCITRASL